MSPVDVVSPMRVSNRSSPISSGNSNFVFAAPPPPSDGSLPMHPSPTPPQSIPQASYSTPSTPPPPLPGIDSVNDSSPAPPPPPDDSPAPPPLPPPPCPDEEPPLPPSSPPPLKRINYSTTRCVNQNGEINRAPRQGPRWGSRDISVFDIIEQVGEGTYGEVFKGRCKSTKEIVALKKIRMDKEKEGFPITAIREIKILKSLQHPNIVNLKEIVTSKGSFGDKNGGSVYLVFEYLDHDLSGLLETPNVHFSRLHVKCYMKQLLDGVAYMHKNKILHRDIKGPNLLLDNEGRLKIADWGLARPWNERNERLGYTNNVITLWYRPPELLAGAVNYGPAVDMWSVGCIFAELLYGKPILPGRDEMTQLNLIFDLCGSPSNENWPSFDSLPNAKKVEFTPRQSTMRQKFEKRLSSEALDLIERLLTLDPKKRISAEEALDHNYFWADPIACQPHELPRFRVASVHEYQVKKRRMQERERENSKRSRSNHHYHPYHHGSDRNRHSRDRGREGNFTSGRNEGHSHHNSRNHRRSGTASHGHGTRHD